MGLIHKSLWFSSFRTRFGNYFDIDMFPQKIGVGGITNDDLLINMIRYSFHWENDNEFMYLFEYCIKRNNQDEHQTSFTWLFDEISSSTWFCMLPSLSNHFVLRRLNIILKYYVKNNNCYTLRDKNNLIEWYSNLLN